MTDQIHSTTPFGTDKLADSAYKTSHTAVRKARRFAVQGLYEWLMTDYRFARETPEFVGNNAPQMIVARTRADNAMHTVHLGYYHELMRAIPDQANELVMEVSRHLDRAFGRLDGIEQAILLVGAYELKHSLHIPYKVVLDEAMKLNNHFGATDGHKLINAVLDRLAKVVRETEVTASKAQNANASAKKIRTKPNAASKKSDLPNLENPTNVDE